MYTQLMQTTEILKGQPDSGTYGDDRTHDLSSNPSHIHLHLYLSLYLRIISGACLADSMTQRLKGWKFLYRRGYITALSGPLPRMTPFKAQLRRVRHGVYYCQPPYIPPYHH